MLLLELKVTLFLMKEKVLQDSRCSVALSQQRAG